MRVLTFVAAGKLEWREASEPTVAGPLVLLERKVKPVLVRPALRA